VVSVITKATQVELKSGTVEGLAVSHHEVHELAAVGGDERGGGGGGGRGGVEPIGGAAADAQGGEGGPHESSADSLQHLRCAWGRTTERKEREFR